MGVLFAVDPHLSTEQGKFPGKSSLKGKGAGIA